MKFSVSGIQIRHAYPWPHRVLSRIFVLGGKVIVDGGCSHRPQFSRGVWGGFFLNFEPSESGSEAI